MGSEGRKLHSSLPQPQDLRNILKLFTFPVLLLKDCSQRSFTNRSVSLHFLSVSLPCLQCHPWLLTNSSVACQAHIHFLPAESHLLFLPISSTGPHRHILCSNPENFLHVSVCATISSLSALSVFCHFLPILPTLPTVAAYHPLDLSPSRQPPLGVQGDCLLCLCSTAAVPGSYSDHYHLTDLILFLCICIPQ